MKNKLIRIGTRGSQLALAQAEIVKNKLKEVNPGLDISIEVVETKGDKDLRPLHVIGGKGVFIKELEYALQKQQVDLAVHSLKDITTQLAPGLQLHAFLKAEGVRDVLILHNANLTFKTLPLNAVLATGSLRRQALLKKLRPDIQTIGIRGNVDSRLKKLADNFADGVVLSEAGLIRLGLSHRIQEYFSPDIFCPAPGQGVIALEVRADDAESIALCHQISHAEQTLKTTTELAFLAVVGFGCNTPLGLYATKENDSLYLRIFMSNRQMTQFFDEKVFIPLEKRLQVAQEWGKRCADWMMQNG